MIVITGATGQLGSRVVDRLLTHLPADQVAVSVRDPARAGDLAARGVDVRRGDFAEPDSLTTAFAGADQVLVISADSLGPGAIALHRAAADAGRAVGARVVYTSHQAAAPDSLFAAAPDHAATEAYLASSGTTYTSLRNGFYANTVPFLLGEALQTGVLAAPADGPVSWTTRDDLADAAVAVLLAEGRFDGPTPPLTAAEAVDLEAVAAMLGDLAGRPVERVVLSDDEWVAGLVGHGMPAEQAQLFLGLFLAARRGEFDVVDPALAELVGHEPTPLRSVLADVVG